MVLYCTHTLWCKAAELGGCMWWSNCLVLVVILFTPSVVNQLIMPSFWFTYKWIHWSVQLSPGLFAYVITLNVCCVHTYQWFKFVSWTAACACTKFQEMITNYSRINLLTLSLIQLCHHGHCLPCYEV